MLARMPEQLRAWPPVLEAARWECVQRSYRAQGLYVPLPKPGGMPECPHKQPMMLKVKASMRCAQLEFRAIGFYKGLTRAVFNPPSFRTRRYRWRRSRNCAIAPGS